MPKSIAEQLNTNVFIHDGAHCSEPWAAGLATLLPTIQPSIELKMKNQVDNSAENTGLEATNLFRDKLNILKSNDPTNIEAKKDNTIVMTPFQTTLKPPGLD